MEESDWAWLPEHLLDMILDKLVSFTDYVSFGAVCKQWKCVAGQNKVKFLVNRGCIQVPFLMVPSEGNSEERRSLYSVTQNRVYDFQLRVPYKKRLSGSSHGWLFAVKESLGLTLINPFSGTTIELPPIVEKNEWAEIEFEVIKAILSADPALSPKDYVVTAIYGVCSRLAFIRAGDETWTYIDTEKFISSCDNFERGRYMSFDDVNHYRGQIFAVDDLERVLRIDVNRKVGDSNAPQVEVVAPRGRSARSAHPHQKYLVESSRGDLLIVLRYLNFIYTDTDIEHETTCFKVFKLVLEQCKQVEVQDLGGDTLFLGENHSICVSASKWLGCQPDSIYYTDDYSEFATYPTCGRGDMGVFNVKDRSFQKHYILDPSNNHMPPSIWIVANVVEN